LRSTVPTNRILFRQTAWTADRREFLGRHGNLAGPAALLGSRPLSGRVGAGLDPCAALQTSIELEPDATTEVVFFLGDAADAASAFRTLCNPGICSVAVAPAPSAAISISLDAGPNRYGGRTSASVPVPNGPGEQGLNKSMITIPAGCIKP